MNRTLATIGLMCFLGAAPLRAQDPEMDTAPVSVLKAGEGMTISVPLDTAAVINGSFAIDSAGFATLPILGRLFVHDKTSREIEMLLGQKLSAYIKDTHVMISPVIRLTLIGYWQRPGMHYVNPEASVWEACLAVGGPGGERNMDEWKVMRGEQVLAVSLLNEFSKGTTLRKAGIHSGDIFVIPVPDPQSGFWYWFRESLTTTAQLASIVTAGLTAYLTYLALDDARNP